MTLKDELISLGENQPWENFESTKLGRLLLPMRYEGDLHYFDFYMRIGIHLGQIRQALMSCGHFIKFRAEKRWTIDKYRNLAELDPTKPMDSLYNNHSQWQPALVYDPGQSHSQYLQAQLQNVPDISTIGGTSLAPFPASGTSTPATGTSTPTTGSGWISSIIGR